MRRDISSSGGMVLSAVVAAAVELDGFALFVVYPDSPFTSPDDLGCGKGNNNRPDDFLGDNLGRRGFRRPDGG